MKDPPLTGGFFNYNPSHILITLSGHLPPLADIHISQKRFIKHIKKVLINIYDNVSC